MIACVDMGFDMGVGMGVDMGVHMGGAHGGGPRGGRPTAKAAKDAKEAKEANTAEEAKKDKKSRKEKGGPANAPIPASGPTTASAADAEPPVRVAHASERQRFAAGAPSVVPADAPCPKRHRPRLSEREIAAVFARKTEVRERGIAAILDAARAEGQPIERFMAAIRYDCEQAPKTTNRRQLVEIGVAVPRPDRLPASAPELHHALWCVIYGLARLGIFLTGTERLDDRALLAKLCGRILDDEVRDIPPSADMSEFIDVDPRELPTAADQSVAQEQEPDGLSGPFDFGSDDENDDPSRMRGKPPATATKAGATKVSAAAAVVDRDRLLPRPDRA